MFLSLRMLLVTSYFVTCNNILKYWLAYAASHIDEWEHSAINFALTKIYA